MIAKKFSFIHLFNSHYKIANLYFLSFVSGDVPFREYHAV